MKKMTGVFKLSKRNLITLTSCVSLAIILLSVLASCGPSTPATTGAPTGTPAGTEQEQTYNFLNPKGTPSSGSAPQRVAFNGTLLAAQDFFGATANVAKFGNAPIAQWTDGLPIAVPTEQKVK